MPSVRVNMCEKRSYERFFEQADADNDGYLTFEELENYLKHKGYRGTQHTLEKYFRSLDISGQNKISQDDYLRAMGQLAPKEHGGATMRYLFREFDRDGSGEIDRTELKLVFREMGKYFTDEDLQRMIALADKDESGIIDYEEFIAYFFGQDSSKVVSRQTESTEARPNDPEGPPEEATHLEGATGDSRSRANAMHDGTMQIQAAVSSNEINENLSAHNADKKE